MKVPRTNRLDEITEIIIGCAIAIHRKIGPGVLESVYEVLLAHYLVMNGLKVQRQYAVPICIDGLEFDEGFRVDLLVEELVPVELKSIHQLNAAHSKVVLAHLKLMQLPLGLLINFGQETLIAGLKRIVNDLDPGDSPTLRVNQSPK